MSFPENEAAFSKECLTPKRDFLVHRRTSSVLKWVRDEKLKDDVDEGIGAMR